MQPLAQASAVVTLCAIDPDSNKRYSISARRDRVQPEALALRDLLMAHGLSTIEKPFPYAEWKGADGSIEDCFAPQLVVTINQVRFSGYPSEDLSPVISDPYEVCWLESDLEPGHVPRLEVDAAHAEILARVASGTSTASDAEELSRRLSERRAA